MFATTRKFVVLATSSLLVLGIVSMSAEARGGHGHGGHHGHAGHRGGRAHHAGHAHHPVHRGHAVAGRRGWSGYRGAGWGGSWGAGWWGPNYSVSRPAVVVRPVAPAVLPPLIDSPVVPTPQTIIVPNATSPR